MFINRLSLCHFDMIKDDWSLKGKVTEENIDIWETNAVSTGQQSTEFVVRTIDEIHEHLRQKLIEDLENIREDLFSGRNWKVIMKQNINKRFGGK